MQHDSFAFAPVFPFPVSVGAHSLLDPPHEVPLCGRRQRDRFGRLAESSAATGYEPNDFIEEDTSEVAPTIFQVVSACASTQNSRQDGAVTPVEPEINDAQIIGMLASPLFSKEREASADPPGNYHSGKENSGQSPSSFRSNSGNPMEWFSHRSTGKSVAMFSQERDSSSET